MPNLNALKRERAEEEGKRDAYLKTVENIRNKDKMRTDEFEDGMRLCEKAEERNGRITDLDKQIAAAEALEARIKGRALGLDDGPARGEIFSTFGEQMLAIVEAARPGGQTDPRLYKAQQFASGMNQGVGSEGGFAVEPTFAAEILKRSYETGQVAARCRRFPVGPNANGVKLPVVDETSRATGSRWGGVRVYRVAEAGAGTASKPSVGRLEIDLQKLMGLAYATDELLQDSVQLGQFLTDAFSEELAFALDDEIIRGNGGAQCIGLLNSSALVTVAKESNQTADTINLANVFKMWGRCWARSRKNAAWFVNQDAEPQLWQLVSTLGSGGVPVFMPPGGASESPFSTLMGRPVIPIEQCSTLGDLGDIILADMSQYLIVEKPMQSATSMHVRFVYDEMCFRVVWRVRGAPIWSAALTPFKGSNSVSPYVTLEAR